METIRESREVEVCNTIARQLGRQAFYMLNIKRYTTAGKNKLGFLAKIAGVKYNYMEITLNSMDTYDMAFIKMHGGREVRKEIREGIYSDQIHEMIREVTGMATSLPRITSR